MKYILSTAHLNATGHRWVVELADFKFDIKYRPGKVNVDADVLSCLLLDIEKYIFLCTCNASESTINAAVNNVQAQVQFSIPWISSVTAHSLKVQPDEEFLHQKPKEPLNMKSLLTAQECDLAISTVVQYKLSGHKPSYQCHRNKKTPATREYGISYSLERMDCYIVKVENSPSLYYQDHSKNLSFRNYIRKWGIWAQSEFISWLVKDFLAQYVSRYRTLCDKGMSLPETASSIIHYKGTTPEFNIKFAI